MGVHESRGNLAKAMKELMQRWAETKQGWNDARSAEFEDRYLRELESDLRTAGSAMEQMGVLLNQVRRDCE